MPTDKSGKYNRINPADHTNHNGQGTYHPSKMGKEPDGDEGPKGSFKMTPTITIGKPNPEANRPNTPRSANTEKHPVTPKGKPMLITEEKGGSGTKSTKGDPSFSEMGTQNKPEPKKLNPQKDMGKK